MTHIDRVAEAMCRWDNHLDGDMDASEWMDSQWGDHYRDLAQVAIDALGLTEEWAEQTESATCHTRRRKMSTRVEVYEKESWTGGPPRIRRIVFNDDGSVEYPDGVPLANNWPDQMTPEYARRVFEAYGYGMVEDA